MEKPGQELLSMQEHLVLQTAALVLRHGASPWIPSLGLRSPR